MRIATLYGDINSCGRNDGSPLYLNRMLQILFGNENVLHILPSGDWETRYGKFDYHFLIDWGEDALGLQNFKLPKPSVYITSDTHLGYEYRAARAKEADFVFCNQKRAVNDFAGEGVEALWLPHAYDPLAYSPGVFNEKLNAWDGEATPLKRYDVCFIGNLNEMNRVEHLDALFKAFPEFYWGNQRFHLAAEKFNQSRIVFNVSTKDDVNMRVFEALGSGAFLLTNDIPTLHDLFEDGKHLVMYKDKKEMVEKARYYLEHADEREAIARAGQELALNRHTYMHRLMTVLDNVGIEYDKNLAQAYVDQYKRKALALT